MLAPVAVPLVLLTGFLGAGKTTLLNALLARRGARGAAGKLGVIVNELGAIGIDGALLGGPGAPRARQIELPGGCVCCVLGDDLDRTLLDMVDANPELDAIVLETTGVAEPLPIAWALQREPVASRVRLAAVVTVVDALGFRASRPLSPAVDGQVAYADVLLVTKAELAGADETAAVVAAIRTLASRALVKTEATEAHVAWLDQTLADPEVERVARTDAAPGAHVHDEHCRHLDEGAHGIDSVWIPVDGVLDLEELEDQLAALPANYVRIKGILQATDGRAGPEAAHAARWTVVHRVGLRVSSEPLAPERLREFPGTGRLVALGAGVAREPLAACVAAAAN